MQNLLKRLLLGTEKEKGPRGNGVRSHIRENNETRPIAAVEFRKLTEENYES